MGRKVKCQWCGEKSDSDEMKFELYGAREQKKYYHKNCYNYYLKDKKFKEKERVEKDNLIEKIKKIYNVKEVPRQVYPLIEALRNGQPVFGNRQNTGKRYKEGYSYNLIEKTYDYCADTIEYWNSVKGFDSFMGAFKYGLSIVIDKIYFVEKKEEEKENKDILIEKHIKKAKETEVLFETSYMKPKKINDISVFLDD